MIGEGESAEGNAKHSILSLVIYSRDGVVLFSMREQHERERGNETVFLMCTTIPTEYSEFS